MATIGLEKAIQFQTEITTMSVRIRFFIANDDLALSRIFLGISSINSSPLISKFILEILIAKKVEFHEDSKDYDLTAMKSKKVDLHITRLTPCLTDLHAKLLDLKFHSAQVLHIKKLLAEYSQPKGLPASPQIIQPFQEDSTLKIITSPVNSLDAPAAVPPSTDDEKAFSQNIKSAKALFKSI